MKFKSQIFFVIGLLLFISSCSDIIEPSINDEKVIVVAPINGLSTDIYTVSFWWNEIDNALKYNLQIVSPNFDSISTIKLDTNTTKNKFTVSLKPGRYQWRVRAENESSETGYTTGNLTVRPSALSGQVVNLLYPLDDSASQSASFRFSWEELFGAKKYLLQIDYDSTNFNDLTKLVRNTTTTKLFQDVTLPREAKYRWRIQAQSDSLTSEFSSAYLITYDNTKPDTVILMSPLNGASELVQPVSLRWKAVTGAESYNVFIYRNNTSTPIQSENVTTNSYSRNIPGITATDKILWRVSAIDRAENESNVLSTPWTFSIK